MPLRFIWGRMTISFLVAITQHQPNLTHIPAIDSAPLKIWIIMKTRLRCVSCLTTVLSIVNVGLLSTASQYCRKWTHYLSLMGWHGLNLSPKPAPWPAHPHGSAGTYEQIAFCFSTHQSISVDPIPHHEAPSRLNLTFYYYMHHVLVPSCTLH